MSRSLYGQPKSHALKSFYIKLCANCYHIIKVRNVNDHNAQYECKYKTSNLKFIVEEKRGVLSTNAIIWNEMMAKKLLLQQFVMII